jgi:N-carbamoyl-L-amino-acid hydrolase
MSRDKHKLLRVDPERLWRRHIDMSKLGSTDRGGVNRAALTIPDVELHLELASWARERNFEVEIDDYGNQFMRRAGSEPQCHALVSGSHSDTQPTGGRFDGISGVLAAMEALEVIDDAQICTRHPIEVVVWNNEEGTRFSPSDMGSAVYVGQTPIERMLAATDDEGVSMAIAVNTLRASIDWAIERQLGTPISAYLELHIEQGPILENENIDIGIVTGIQGTRKFEVRITGEEAHAGTTPESNRQDAFMDAVKVVNALQEIFFDPEDKVRFTIGRFEVSPGSLAVVPGHVLFTIDFRHPENTVLQILGDQIAEVCKKTATRCTTQVVETRSAPSTLFGNVVQEVIEECAKQRTYSFKYLPSGAGHDARYMNSFCPTGMVFVPCRKGISHNEKEYASPDSLAKGAQVVVDSLLMLDGLI